MSKQTPRVGFDEIATVINSDYEVHKNKAKECCVKSSILPLSDYYEAIQTEYRKIESSITPPRTRPDPLKYMDIFQAFDEYPSNLPKPKKHLVKDYSRLNATIKSKQNSSSSSVNTSKTIVDKPPSAATIYNNFCKFTQKLAEFKKELRLQATSEEYAEKLDSVNVFASELDKLLPSGSADIDAFTSEEEAKIKKISEYMEHFVYIQENQDLYTSPEEGGTNSARLNDLVDIVTDALVAVNCYTPSS